MADNDDQVLDPQVEDPEPEPPPDDGQQPVQQIDENERRTWEGRLRVSQAKEQTTRESLQAMGWDLDDSGRPYQVQQQTGYQQTQQTQDADEDFEWTPGNLRNMIQQEATRIAGQMVGGIMPVIDRSLETALGQQYNDYNEIKQDTTTILRQMGYSGIAHAQASNPAHLEIAIQAARGRRGAAQPTPPDPVLETQRQQRLAAAATPAAPAAPAGKGYGFSEEELAGLQRAGINPEDADKMLNSGKAGITFDQMFGGDK